MNAPGRPVAILLAAGGGARFGGDKLDAMIGAQTVLERSAAAVAASGCRQRVAVVSEKTQMHAPLLSGNGFEIIVNTSAAEGMSSSIRAGFVWAEAKGAGAALIALADMPLVPVAHFSRLLETFEQSAIGISCSADAGRRMPPAVFGSRWFAHLQALEGDAGARALLDKASAGDVVEAAPGDLDDIDSQDDLRRFNC